MRIIFFILLIICSANYSVFGYSDTDFDEMTYDEILNYLTDSQRKELKEYNE